MNLHYCRPLRASDVLSDDLDFVDEVLVKRLRPNVSLVVGVWNEVDDVRTGQFWPRLVLRYWVNERTGQYWVMEGGMLFGPCDFR